MTEAPEKMWVFPKADWFNAGASNVRISSLGGRDVEYTRSDIADDLQAEVARLREALVLVTREYDPSDYGGISEAMFTIAGDALEYGEDK